MQRIKAPTIVDYGQGQKTVLGFEGHLDVAGRSMPGNIGQRFLSNSIGSG
jgi:hypothetical protein